MGGFDWLSIEWQRFPYPVISGPFRSFTGIIPESTRALSGQGVQLSGRGGRAGGGKPGNPAYDDL